MKNRIKNIVKKSIIIYNIYFYVFSFLLKILGLFIKTDNNLILFVSYGGKKFDDSPRVVYEYMKNNEKYNNYKYVWAFEKKDKFNLLKDEKVKIDTFKYYKIALKAKYWITNSSVVRGLDFKKKNTKYIIFRHGTFGLKRLGKDIPKNNESFKILKEEKVDLNFVQGKLDKDILRKAFNNKKEVFEYGLPRNDELWNMTEEKVSNCRKKLKIPEGKKVILYAPTYREFYKDEKLNSFVKMPFDIEKMKKQLSNEYVLLVTAHYEVYKILDIPQNDPFVINAFDYPYINDLLIASDIMISDYSSIVFDYSILERPILCYGYDYDLYMEKRGTYVDLNELFYDGVIKNNEELIYVIKNMDYKVESEHTKKIKNEYILNNKECVDIVVNTIFD